MMTAEIQAFTACVSPKDLGGDDFVVTARLADGSVLAALADGATVGGFGAVAARCFIAAVLEWVRAFDPSGDNLKAAFTAADEHIQTLAPQCETTGIAIVVKDDCFAYASVGDSVAYMQSRARSHPVALNAGQPRKPRIGRGIGVPKFCSGQTTGTIVLASDGLNMLPEQVFSLLDVARRHYPDWTPAEFLAACCTRRGLHDDIGLVVLRFPAQLLDKTNAQALG